MKTLGFFFFFAFASVSWNNKTEVKAWVDSIVSAIVQVAIYIFGRHKPRDGAFVYRNERRPAFSFNLNLLRKWNPFAPGNFTPKTHFKARRTILQSQMIKTPFIGRALHDLLVPSVSAFEVWTCAESKISWLLITFRFLSSICFVFLAPCFFFRWTFTMLHFGGKSFWKSFWEGRPDYMQGIKCWWVVEQDFLRNSSGRLPSWLNHAWVSLPGLKDLFRLYKFDDVFLNFANDSVTSGRRDED